MTQDMEIYFLAKLMADGSIVYLEGNKNKVTRNQLRAYKTAEAARRAQRQYPEYSIIKPTSFRVVEEEEIDG